MHKITHFFSALFSKIKNIQLTTPVAIILGSLILACGMVSYGFITRGNGMATTVVENPLPKILKAVGVHGATITSCVRNGDQAATVAASLRDGIAAGVNGTPNTFIIKMTNGVPYVVANISGAQSAQYFTQAIEQALSSAPTAELPRFNGRAVDQAEIEGGDSHTGVYVIEYSDAECPFCIRLHNTMKQLRTNYQGRISFVYRNFPLTSIHEHAEREAEIISCVFKEGGEKALYPFIDAIFDFKIKNNIGYLPID